LTKAGSGDWTLNGASTYGGNTTVNAGNLIAGRNALNNASGAFGQQNNVDLNLGVANGNSNAGILIGGAYTIGRTIRNATQNTTDSGTRILALGGTTAHSSIYSAAIYLGTASQTTKGVTLTAASGGTVTFSGVIQDPTGQDATELANARSLTAVTKTGLGTVALTAANTYFGGTTVSQGTLSLGNGTANSALSNYADLSVASGAVLNLNFSSGNPDTVLRLYLDGSPAAIGTWGATGSGATNIDDTHFTGTGVINNLNGVLANEYLWDGGSVNIAGDGNAISAGGAGTWDTTIQNWDKGLTAHAAWGNTTSDRAVFGGDANAAYTVTVSGSLTIKDLIFNTLGTAGPRYTIDGGTLNFGPGGMIANSNNQYDQTITSAITGSPAVNIKDFGAGNTYLGLKFAPSSGTQTLGAVLNPDNTGNTDKAGITLAGATTGNSVASITYAGSDRYADVKVQGGEWTVGDIDTGSIRLSAGKLIANGTTRSGYYGFVFTGGTLAGTGTVAFASTTASNFVVAAAARLAPGNPTGTLNVSATNCTINGTFEININGALAGKLAVNPSATFNIGSGVFLDVNVLATPVAPVTIATYGSGKRTGTFASNDLPNGWTIDYGTTSIVLTPPAAGTMILLY
jgi:autotransporter-associated beta strand protein